VGDTHTLLVVPGIVPAGRYELHATGHAPNAGMARMIVGRNARPLATWDLSTLTADPPQVRLPVSVGSLVVTGDDQAANHEHALSLRVVDVERPSQRITQDYARRAERYSGGIAYFLDDGVFVEEPGFWVRGASTARFVAAAAESERPSTLFLRNSAVKNHVTLAIAGEQQSLDLEPREERTVPVRFESPRDAALIEITSASGFHPADVEHGSTDTRYLGVWIELRR